MIDVYSWMLDNEDIFSFAYTFTENDDATSNIRNSRSYFSVSCLKSMSK